MFPSDTSEKSKSAIQNTISGSSERIPVTISITEASLVLRGYSSGWVWDFTPTKAGTLYDAQTGNVIATLSANQTYQHTGATDDKCINYYFK